MYLTTVNSFRLKRVGRSSDKAWYLHIDLDVAGPEANPGNLTPAPHWPPRKHIIEAARATAQTVPIKEASLAVYNPA
jgi:hypothetical protein